MQRREKFPHRFLAARRTPAGLIDIIGRGDWKATAMETTPTAATTTLQRSKKDDGAKNGDDLEEKKTMLKVVMAGRREE